MDSLSSRHARSPHPSFESVSCALFCQNSTTNLQPDHSHKACHLGDLLVVCPPVFAYLPQTRLSLFSYSATPDCKAFRYGSFGVVMFVWKSSAFRVRNPIFSHHVVATIFYDDLSHCSLLLFLFAADSSNFFLHNIQSVSMDPLPPNDPHNNNRRHKPDPYPARRRAYDNNNETMDVLGDLQDSPVVVAMFLIGVAGWFLREHCIC